jgi:ferredoxin
MNECEVEGAIYKRDDGLIIIDPEKCTGCKLCVDTCPYGAIYFNETLRLAQKCTGCAHLLDDGWNEPRCVDVCPTGALKFGEASDLKGLINNADPFRPELKLQTKVHYLHLPRKFVAGTLYDPVEKEVVIGAKCTLTDTASGEIFEAETDHFGDFWFRDMKDDRVFTLGIEKDGKTKAIENINTEKDVNLGDIPLD